MQHLSQWQFRFRLEGQVTRCIYKDKSAPSLRYRTHKGQRQVNYADDWYNLNSERAMVFGSRIRFKPTRVDDEYLHAATLADAMSLFHANRKAMGQIVEELVSVSLATMRARH